MLRRLMLVASLLLLTPTSPAQELKVYFGNLHSHTKYSDGSGTPHDAYRHAREAAKLDFLAITEHSHKAAENSAGERKDGILIAKDPTLYNGPDQFSLIETAKRMTETDKFVALYGQEFSSIKPGNHMNVFDAPELITARNGHFEELMAWLTTHPDSTGKACVVQFNHPLLVKDETIEYGRDDFASKKEWIEQIGSVARTIEILNGPAMAKDGGHQPAEVAEADYKKYLALGFKLAPTADQDNHYFTWGSTTDARTGVVIAGTFDKVALLNALRSRHVYATTDKNLRLIGKVNGHLCGDEFAAPAVGSLLDIDISVRDDDEPEASYVVEVYAGTIGTSQVQLVESFTPPEDADASALEVESVPYSGGHQFVFLKVIQSDEDGNTDLTWSAPVWLNPGGPVDAGSPIVPIAETTIRASRNSNVFHTREDCEFARSILNSNLVTGADAKEGRRQCKKCKELDEGGQ